MNGDVQALLNARNRELDGWERNRRNEVFLDLHAHFWRSVLGVVVAVSLWEALNHFSVPLLSSWRFLVISALAIYLLGTILFWLRMWGAYIERRLEEIEARIQGDDPLYYQGESESRFLQNGLHDRLGRMEEKLDAVIQGEPTSGFLQNGLHDRLGRVEQILDVVLHGETTSRFLQNGLHDRLGRVEEKLDAVIRER